MGSMEHQVAVDLCIINLRPNMPVKCYDIGISPDDAAQIFERYYRVENIDKTTIAGFGIGLYLSAEIVRRHSGNIAVKSEPGRGAEFYFLIPE